MRIFEFFFALVYFVKAFTRTAWYKFLFIRGRRNRSVTPPCSL
jgi:hypothetical protein